MFLNPWSLTLTLGSLIALGLGLLAARTAFHVVRGWNPASDSNAQIRLENETYLTSFLAEYGLGLQIFSLILFVLAANQFCQVIVGAMCATGALVANRFGMPTLLVKLAGLFLYGFWIVLHQLDIKAETYPLVRIKNGYLLALVPLLLTDFTLQSLYIGNLKPDIITSCCAVVFAPATGGDSHNLLAGFSEKTMLITFYSAVAVLAGLSTVRIRRSGSALPLLPLAMLWPCFFVLALIALTSFFSSYIYAMPFHHCPFCILKPEYHFIGYALYGALIGACFFGVTPALVESLRKTTIPAVVISRYQDRAIRVSLALLVAFTLLSSYHYLAYRFLGNGE